MAGNKIVLFSFKNAKQFAIKILVAFGKKADCTMFFAERFSFD